MKDSLRPSILHQLTVTPGRARDGGAPWGAFGARDWERTLAWADLSGLTLYFRESLRQADRLPTLPVPVQAQLDRRAADNQRRTAGMIAELKTLTALLDEADAPYAVLKGLALSPDYCPEPGLRTQYDHDILVSPAATEKVDAALRRAGYRRKRGRESCLVYDRPAPPVRFSGPGEGLFSPLLGRSVELHLALWETAEERIDFSLPDDFLSRAVLRRWDDLAYRALDDEDGLLFQVLHAFRHVLQNWCRLSVLLEIASFLRRRSGDAAFWRRYAHRLEPRERARAASQLIFHLAGRLFGAAIPAAIQPHLTTRWSPVLDLWIETYGARAALANFHDDKSVLFLYREFVDDPAAWKAIRRRRLLPLHRPHRPPAIVFQRGRSRAGRIWMEKVHALRRLRFHAAAGLRYAWQCPRWTRLRRQLPAGPLRPREVLE